MRYNKGAQGKLSKTANARLKGGDLGGISENGYRPLAKIRWEKKYPRFRKSAIFARVGPGV